MLEARTVADSVTEQIRIIRPEDLNGAGNLFGGQLALWIDEVAGIVAKRHSRGMVTTAAIDNLRFREPVYQNEMVVLRGKMTYVGTSSMEVRVDSFVENLMGECRLVNTAFVIMVALDENNKPRKVPGLDLQNGFEQQAFLAGKKRKELRKTLNKELYD